MPGLIVNGEAPRKRKREPTNGATLKEAKPRKAPKKSTEDNQAHILLLEGEILESRSHYNNIVTLQQLLLGERTDDAITAAVALCRVFCRLIAGEQLVPRKNETVADKEVKGWLKHRLRDYATSLARTPWIGGPDGTRESTALTLLMRVVKEELSQGAKRAQSAWRSGIFVTVVSAVLQDDAALARQEFIEKFLAEHDDVRFYTFLAVKEHISAQEGQGQVRGAVELLSAIDGVPEKDEQLEDWYGEQPTAGHQLLSLHAHRKMAQEAWLTVFRSRLTREQRKKLLSLTTHHILPWFTNRIELLADFLTDSFDEGGSLSLLSLSGIFHLMTKRNLDYPDFYAKLYSLLDDDVLHSKHRSRFFRLLSTFMDSTHLPAAMVASFVKRLARLSLQAPPGAIVWIVPWVYNTLRAHPACTFMLHRPKHPTHVIWSLHPDPEENGMDDPFDMDQSDPNTSRAIDSSLWELETLQSHYHPNVATLAKILAEQFTKRGYELDDFSDHTYVGLIEGELGRELKKAPEVEWEIPKRIVTAEEGGLSRIGSLLQAAFDA